MTIREAMQAPYPLITRGGSTRWMILGAILVSPAFGALLRKASPGQPVFMEAAGAGAVLIGGLWLISQRRVLPRWIAGPLLVWAFVQLLYVAPSLADDWRVGTTAVFTRIVPMLMAPIAFAAIRSWDDLGRFSLWVAGLGVLLLPVGIFVVFSGNEELPRWLQPTDKFLLTERQIRGGVPALAAVFSTPAVLSMSMMATTFLALANVAMAETRNKLVTGWWAIALASMLLVLLSTRRGAFLAVALGLVAFLLTSGWLPKRTLIVVLTLVAVVVFIDVKGLVLEEGPYSVRTDLLFDLDIGNRIKNSTAITQIWIQKFPLGSYLGFGGVEHKPFDVVTYEGVHKVVETGSAQLVAEMGVIGLVLMPTIIGLMAWAIFRRAKKLQCRHAVTTLLMFQFALFGLYYTKELTSMNGVSMAQLLFWAVPGICAALIRYEEEEPRVELPGLSTAVESHRG